MEEKDSDEMPLSVKIVISMVFLVFWTLISYVVFTDMARAKFKQQLLNTLAITTADINMQEDLFPSDKVSRQKGANGFYNHLPWDLR